MGDNAKAKHYEVDKVPGIVTSRKKTRIRFCGLPSGYEFNPLTESVVNM